MSQIRTALLSVYDKTGVAELARQLAARGVRLVSTGGTRRHLIDAGLEVVAIEEFTGQAEMLGGRVKTLHPNVFGGILARRETPQMAELAAAGLDAIDLVVVNLYPFAATVADPGHRLIDALEQVDIGGVSLLRAAYKNFAGVAVAVDPADYGDVVAALDAPIALPQRLEWARKAVAHTAAYEAAICNHMSGLDVESVALEAPVGRSAHPDDLVFTFRRVQTLRYGENPHQRAAFYALTGEPTGLAAGVQLQGKELSFNNYLDSDAAWQLAGALPEPGVAIIKHANPCGAGTGATTVEAYRRARATDPTSAFGGIVGVNQPVDASTAEELASTFIEVVIAPRFLPEARAILAEKANLRLIELGAPTADILAGDDVRWVAGGVLVQSRDRGAEEVWQVVTDRAPSAAEERDLRFVWSVVPAVKSNAIVVGRDGQLLGVGAGQMSRVDSCRIATWKATEAGHDLAGSAAASDAFFPFPDGLETLAEAGVTAVVQPGGSKRDDEVIAAANRLGIALVHTGARHFRH